jgi:hypothetical protein
MSELVISVSPKAEVQVVEADLRTLSALEEVKPADVVFGCVDTDYGRLILNELCLAYLIPYIDLGVGIQVDQGRITEAGGRVLTWTPGRACLLCAGEISPRIAAEELESDAQRTFRQKHGYVAGDNVPEPFVISLNSAVASLGVTEFLALATGFRESAHYVYYDMLAPQVGRRIVAQDKNCIACANTGAGDVVNLTRYAAESLL